MGYGLTGIWIGFNMGCACYLIVTMITIFRVNWESLSSRISIDQSKGTDIEIDTLSGTDIDDETSALLRYQENKIPSNIANSSGSRQRAKKDRKRPTVSWRQAVHSKLPVLLILMMFLLASIVLRLTLPPILPAGRNNSSGLNSSELAHSYLINISYP
jgi:hypothetical protein